MCIDPDELKFTRLKREQQVKAIQNYMEEQDALEKQNQTGKLGHRDVKRGEGICEKIVNILNQRLNSLRNGH